MQAGGWYYHYKFVHSRQIFFMKEEMPGGSGLFVHHCRRILRIITCIVRSFNVSGMLK